MTRVQIDRMINFIEMIKRGVKTDKTNGKN